MDIKLKTREFKLRSGVNQQEALNQKGVKQVGVKQGLRCIGKYVGQEVLTSQGKCEGRSPSYLFEWPYDDCRAQLHIRYSYVPGLC
jgi:hypothetical protein